MFSRYGLVYFKCLLLFNGSDMLLVFGVSRTIYNMCTQKPPHDYSQQLYDKYREAFEEYITSTVRLIMYLIVVLLIFLGWVCDV